MTGSVLIVDDSLTVRMDLVDAFEAAGFEARPCASVAEARDALARTDFDVVVLDVLLPDGDGIELLTTIRASPAGARAAALMLSTENEVKARVRGLTTGADAYVGKPYDAASVVARAREILRGRGSPLVPHPGQSVLIIDDSSTYREELRKLLESAGYAVVTAASGEDGLRVAADQRPAAILVDGVLPGIDGATVIRRVRLDTALRNVPCILLTASEDRSAELRALDAGADAFVRKDEEPTVVLARLAAVQRPGGMPSEEGASLLGPKKVLAVDDSPTYLNELATALRSEGYEVVLARSGEEALELLAVEPVDCILLDLVMPGLGGHEACRRIKTVPAVRDVPLIMLTAVEGREAMIQGLAVGADDYLPKSTEFDVLRARVRAQIRRRHFEDENRRIREVLLLKELEASEARSARELAETRAALVEELERKNQELEAFSYSVSHDLRAPLRGITGFSQALLDDHSGQLDARGQDYLRRVIAAGRRMGELIDDLLQLSRVGRAELRPTSTDLSQIARGVLAELAHQEPDRQVEVTVDDGLLALADPRLVSIVLDNLLGNAWKFTSQRPRAHIRFGAEERGGSPAFLVRDDGAGFDMAYAEKLFQPFQRLHHEADFPGTGIGLVIVQRIVDRHGGRVWAESAVDRGTTFYFTLPEAGGSDS